MKERNRWPVLLTHGSQPRSRHTHESPEEIAALEFTYRLSGVLEPTGTLCRSHSVGASESLRRKLYTAILGACFRRPSWRTRRTRFLLGHDRGRWHSPVSRIFKIVGPPHLSFLLYALYTFVESMKRVQVWWLLTVEPFRDCVSFPIHTSFWLIILSLWYQLWILVII